MKYKDLIQELQHKERSVSDLASYLKTRVSEQSPNYSFLLGAGASRSSGISTGGELVDLWREEIYRRESGSDDYTDEIAKKYFIQNGGAWYSPSNEYSSLFEKKYDLPAQRRRFVEQQVDKTLPSIGYSYLVSLTNPSDQFVNTIFTTNFDDLINESFYQFSRVRPLVCAHDSSVKSVSINSSRPKIIKLHGDYLFNDIKSTLRETESLEVNTKDKLIEFSKEYGIVVVGYSGSDRSIMDTLNYLLKTEDYLKNGVYWCLRDDDEVNPELRKLLWKDRVYFVKVDGFDELMAEVHHEIKGPLSLKDNFTDAKKDLIVDSFAKDKFSLSAKSELIRKDLENLKKHKNDQDISNLIRELSGGKSADGSEGLSESDFKNLLDIDHLFKCRKFQEARDQANIYLSDCKDDALKPRYLKRLIDINKEIGDTEESLRLCDSLIELDQFNPDYVIIKASIYKDLSKRCEYVKSQRNNFENSYSFYNYLVKEGMDELKFKPDGPVFNVDSLLNMNSRCLELEPSPSNPAWSICLDLICEKYRGLMDKASEKEKKDKIDEMLGKLRSINPDHIRLHEIDVDRLGERNTVNELKEKLEVLKSIYLKSREGKKKRMLELMCNLCMKFVDSEGADSLYKKIYKEFIESDFFHSIKNKEEISSVNLMVAYYNINIQKDVVTFKENIMRVAVSDDTGLRSSFVIESLCDIVKDFSVAYLYLDRISDHLTEASYFYHKSSIDLAVGDFDLSLESIDKSSSYGLSRDAYVSRRTFILLKSKKYEQAISYVDLNLEYVVNPATKDSVIVNREVAVNLLGNKIKDVSIRSVISRGLSKELVFAAHCLLGQDIKAQRLMDKAVELEYMRLYSFKNWPLIPLSFFEKYNQSKKEETELIVHEDVA